jgi:4-hydroxy-tetrahydrodipicolinate synthase
MAKIRKLEGVIPVLVTPMRENGDIDEEGIERLVEFLVGKGVGGLWVLGTGSEDMNLTYNKRLQVARRVTATNGGRVPIALGAGFFALEDTLSFMRDTEDLEFDAYHVMPYHPVYSVDLLQWHYRHVADNAPKPIWMYTSANWCRPIAPDDVLALKGYPNICGIKFSSSNATHNMKVLAAGDENFQVTTAVVTQFYACLRMGSMAHTSSIGSALPEPMLEIYRLFREEKHEEALAAQLRFSNFLDATMKGAGKDNFLKGAEEKFILSLRGICERHMSAYYREVNEAEMENIKKKIKEYGMSLDGLPSGVAG